MERRGGKEGGAYSQQTREGRDREARDSARRRVCLNHQRLVVRGSLAQMLRVPIGR